MRWNYHKSRFDVLPGMGAYPLDADAAPQRRGPLYLLFGLFTALVFVSALRVVIVDLMPSASPLLNTDALVLQILVTDSILATMLVLAVWVRANKSRR